MSIKDHRRSISLTADAPIRALLRRHRHVRANGSKGSLADTVRKLVQARDIAEVCPLPPAVEGQVLLVQLPRKLRASVEARAIETGSSPEAILRGALLSD